MNQSPASKLPGNESAAVPDAGPRFSPMPRAGEPAPWFRAATADNPGFNFSTVAGRRSVLVFFGASADPVVERILADMRAAQERLAQHDCSIFGVATEPEHARQHSSFLRILPGACLFHDPELEVSRLYGVAPLEGGGYRPSSFILDERLRVVAALPFAVSPETHAERIVRILNDLPPLEPAGLAGVPAPVLVVPRIFELALCDDLIAYYDRNGGEESGFMREVAGRTVLVHDDRHKRRRDRPIEDDALRKACMHRIHDRLLPEIQKAFQFRATRIERYIVACYDAADAGHFRAHRDNTTSGTAHRRFAVSLNLNTGVYQGGLLRFPEFGGRLYQAPAGGAVVFSCSLLHEATQVTKGRRYAFLPFLYDEAAATIREMNMPRIDCNKSIKTK